MAALRDLPIRIKLRLIMIVTSGSALLLAGTAVMLWNLMQVRSAIQRDMEALADIIATNSTAALAFNDAGAAQETLSAVEVKPNVRAACLYGPDGSLFAKYVSNEKRAGPLPSKPRAEGFYFDGNALSVFRSVVLEKKVLGTVYLSSDLNEIYARLRLQAVTMAVLLVLSSMMVFVLSGRLGEVIAGPVLHLAGIARTITQLRDYSIRGTKTTSDELGFLVDSFNQMLSQIHDRDVRLQVAKEELESRVQERTFQLQQELAERLRTEEELQRRNAELDRSNKDLDDFAYIASHDLKEPLRGIHNYSMFLLEDHGGRLPEDARAKLETLGRLSRRMEELIDSLLHYSRVGRVDLVVEPVDLNKVVADVVESIQISLEEYRVEVRIPRPFPTVPCDRVRITEVFRNIMTNAMKYNDKPERWIEVGYCTGQEYGVRPPTPDAISGNGNVYYVRDNGIGIQAKYFESIFRIFKRLHGRDRFGGGSGAGLTIAKKIIERHGGLVWLESTSGQGTTFYFTI